MTARPEPQRFRWGFSTLGCTELSLPDVCDLAARNGFFDIEVRGLWGRVDLDRYCAGQNIEPETAKQWCRDRGVRIVVLGSSFKLLGGSAGDRAEFLDYCEWANSWGVPFVRVFGGGKWGDTVGEPQFHEAMENIAAWRREKAKRGWEIEMLLETHDAFSGSAPCAGLMRRLDEPTGIIWDSHHTWRLAGEPPARTWDVLSPWIRHVHVKDSIGVPSARHPYTYVMPGAGEMPLADTIHLLREKHFSGVVSLEWERHWHPYLPPLAEALECFRAQDWFDPAAGR